MLLYLLACNTTEMAQSYEIDRLRILAVAAEPAEPRPGDVVTFTSLTVSPVDGWGGSIWFACAGTDADEFGCAADTDALAGLEGLDPTTMTEEELAELYEQLVAAGLIGYEPLFPPTWVVPADLLDGLSEEERLEGALGYVTINAFPATESFDESDIELAYKRVPISEALTPNHNPSLIGLSVDGVMMEPGVTLHLDRGEPYTLTPILGDDAVESYTYRNTDGVDETRTEEPYFTWYLQEGEFDQSFSLYGEESVTWTSPTNPTLSSQSLWVVIRDRRGGMAWLEQKISFD